jgi:hypothetical protein
MIVTTKQDSAALRREWLDQTTNTRPDEESSLGQT